MDQDFHYHGTYYAAVVAGFPADEAALVARASNFIDFCSESTYAAYWALVRDERRPASGNYDVSTTLAYPRYTFQGGWLGTGVLPEDSLWCSYHFPPGNYADPAGSFSHEETHGSEVAGRLPGHKVRAVQSKVAAEHAPLLNRPQSALSRAIIRDTVRILTQDADARRILSMAQSSGDLLDAGRAADSIRRFRLILLGARAHTIADTWAHQDFAGVSSDINTYRDAGSGVGRQAIFYKDVGGWQKTVLASTRSEAFMAVPNATSYLGHGWMGHLPDYSFIRYRYRPWWQARSADLHERDNPVEYRHAFLELCSLFAQARGEVFDPGSCSALLDAAARAIASPVRLSDRGPSPRKHSERAWLAEMGGAGLPGPPPVDTLMEPDPATVLPGLVEYTQRMDRYATIHVNVWSDLYLFQIAADYQFWFVQKWLERNGIRVFKGHWSKQGGPLGENPSPLF